MPGGDTAVGRRAVVEGFEDVAEAFLHLLWRVAQDGEDLFLHLPPVDADAAASQLGAVADQVVGAGRVWRRGRRRRAWPRSRGRGR